MLLTNGNIIHFQYQEQLGTVQLKQKDQWSSLLLYFITHAFCPSTYL